ncbi:MBL fold metallo-hydrolase [Aeromicrobium sp. YIM 150415]|uniref:MBL fold metallo-hydrolase n=1 Tax=Aeromicrobium sp. YIM 150415 TaxID=2803912 RepID=UPI0019649CA0|nr:MBL fold metallo-hydrolase [Aeromicrobium sp. YIM 150415]MBM9464044.1 MBL fold metallo-hydrolase [Aeromicrobium sp. YIM 150415]
MAGPGGHSRAWYTDGPEQVADGVVRIPMAVGVEELHAVNLYALRAHDGAMDLIDAGDASAATPDDLDRVLRSLGSGIDEVHRIFVTHSHPDHYTLAPLIRRRSGATVYLGEGEQPNINELNRLIRGEREVQIHADLKRVGGTVLIDELEPERLARPGVGSAVEAPDVWVADGQEFDAGASTLAAIATPGHTRGHLVFHESARGLYFSGDHVLPRITPAVGFESAPVAMALADYLQSLRRVLHRPDGMLLPAHGPVTPSIHARARELLEHHEARLAITLDAVDDRGSTPFEVAHRLRWTRRDRSFSSLHPWHRLLASTETAAHLDVLVTRGMLQRSTSLDGPDSYRPRGGAHVA